MPFGLDEIIDAAGQGAGGDIEIGGAGGIDVAHVAGDVIDMIFMSPDFGGGLSDLEILQPCGRTADGFEPFTDKIWKNCATFHLKSMGQELG